MNYIVLLREDSIGPIFQEQFRTLEEAQKCYESAAACYYFRKLCIILQDSRDDE
jgi:hypothetical protein